MKSKTLPIDAPHLAFIAPTALTWTEVPKIQFPVICSKGLETVYTLSTWIVKTPLSTGEFLFHPKYHPNLVKGLLTWKRNTNNENHYTTRSHYTHHHRACDPLRRHHLHRHDRQKVPLLSNVRVDIILLVIIGMTICQQGGIGRVAATGQWSHPLSIVGYLLGGLILIVSLAVFVGWKLSFVANEQQALLAIAILASLKVVNAVTHYLLSSS